ncbi:MAG: DUF6788 family protein [Bryobacteraceae bacterium]
MKASSGLGRLSELALRQQRQGLAKQLPSVTDILRGSLVERYVTCGNPACKCAKGERHGPIWYLTVTLGPGHTTGGIIAADQLEEVRGWIENYHQLKENLEKISEINRELLRRQRERQRKGERGRKR